LRHSDCALIDVVNAFATYGFERKFTFVGIGPTPTKLRRIYDAPVQPASARGRHHRRAVAPRASRRRAADRSAANPCDQSEPILVLAADEPGAAADPARLRSNLLGAQRDLLQSNPSGLGREQISIGHQLNGYDTTLH
jgi:hypothetical protein